jgi:ethanolamine utilization protein EutN
MIRGTVVGEVWATRKSEKLEGRRLLLVGVDGADRVMVAIDTLDAREGQKVLVAVGSGARNVLKPGPDNRDLLCDAAIALLVDGEG